MPAADELPGGRWKAGVNYKPIVPAQPTDVPAGKSVMEVFWYGCGHCFARTLLQNWENRSQPVEFVRVRHVEPGQRRTRACTTRSSR